jgi:hypothetical protein
VEPTNGIEPLNLFLTKEALYRLSYVGDMSRVLFEFPILEKTQSQHVLERETRFELATSSLEG